jgi:hypothetical protein
MLPFMDDDKDDGAAMAIAKMVKENIEPEIDPAVEAKKHAAKKMMSSIREDDLETFMKALDEFNIIMKSMRD